MALLSIGDRFPDFKLRAVKPGVLQTVDAYTKEDFFMEVSNQKDYADQWTVIFFWPKNFSIVCPTEITAFAQHYNDFDKLNTRIIGITTDNEYSSFAWRKIEPELRAVPFPLASDFDHSLSLACGAWGNLGECDRVTFILDPEGVVRYVCATSSYVGRSVKETLRQVQALQTNEYCMADWQTSDKYINPLDDFKVY